MNIHNNSTKKNESQQINNKPTQTSNKMNNTANQPKNPPQPSQPNQHQQLTMTQNEQIQTKQQIAQIEPSREISSQKNTIKPSHQAQDQPKHVTNHAMRQPQPLRRIQHSIMGPPLTQSPKQQPQNQQQTASNQTDKFRKDSSQDQTEAAVIFAEHIQVREEDCNHYTFGFFEEPTIPQTQQTKTTLINHSSHVNSTRKQISQQPSKNEQKPKQSIASPNSEENCYKLNDNVDTNNFNYDQILKFISSGKFKTLT